MATAWALPLQQVLLPVELESMDLRMAFLRQHQASKPMRVNQRHKDHFVLGVLTLRLQT